MSHKQYVGIQDSNPDLSFPNHTLNFYTDWGKSEKNLTHPNVHPG